MKDSVSFQVDHSKLDRGIYLSKIDHLGQVDTVTLDIRMRKPYQEPILPNETLHTMEHCFATAVRDVCAERKKESVAYFGPMGCQTGFYLVVNFLDTRKEEIYPILSQILQEAMTELKQMKEVPAKNALQCGYYLSLTDMDALKPAMDDLAAMVDGICQRGQFDSYVYLGEK